MCGDVKYYKSTTELEGEGMLVSPITLVGDRAKTGAMVTDLNSRSALH